jgi:hypothetical protein
VLIYDRVSSGADGAARSSLASAEPLHAAYSPSRSRTLMTWVACHLPPDGVWHVAPIEFFDRSRGREKMGAVAMLLKRQIRSPSCSGNQITGGTQTIRNNGPQLILPVLNNNIPA